MSIYHTEAREEASQEDDSPWMEDGEGEGTTASASAQHELAVSTQEWEKLSLKYSDAGYREGITAGKNARLQTGFDQGFATAAPLARQVGNLRGIAASLLSILTTTSGAKHASAIDTTLGSPERKAEVVSELRAVVSALGKLDENKVLPVDQEAEEHAKSHADEAGVMSQSMADKREMDDVEAMLNGLGSGKGPAAAGLEECQARLTLLLRACGLEGVIPIRG